MFWSVIAACAFDPKNPNAPCNDVIRTPTWAVPLLLLLVVVAMVAVAVALLRVLRRRRALPHEGKTG